MLKPGTSQNDQKPAETSRNERKQPPKMRNDPKRPKTSKMRKSWIFYWLSNFDPICPNLAFWAKKHYFFNLNKILHVPYFEGADFKSDICFQKFGAQIKTFGYFGPKSINFLILKNIVCTVFRRSYFQIWHLFSKFSIPNQQIWVFWAKKYQFSNLEKYCL